MGMSRRLLVSLVVLALAVAAVGAGTWAAFSDTEASTGNAFTAGTMDLKIKPAGVWPAVWTDDPVVRQIIVTDLKPGDAYLGVGSTTLKNTGTVPGVVWLEIKNIRNTENGCLEPEQAAGDDSASEVGELPAKIEILTQINEAPWGRSWDFIANLDPAQDGVRVDGVPGDAGGPTVLQPGEELPLYFRAHWDNDHSDAGVADNKAMTDKVTFDIVFHMDQVH